MANLRKQYREPGQSFYLERMGQPIKQGYLDKRKAAREKLARLAMQKRFRRWAIHRGLWPSTPEARP